MLLLCYSLLHSQIISSIVEKVGFWDTSGVSKKKKKKNCIEVAQREE